jgi:hypothetical protein
LDSLFVKTSLKAKGAREVPSGYSCHHSAILRYVGAFGNRKAVDTSFSRDDFVLVLVIEEQPVRNQKN